MGINKFKMTKKLIVITILLILATIITLSGCSNKDSINPAMPWKNLYHATTLMAVVSSTTQLVAVGTDGCIKTSPDALTWTNRISGTTNILFAITYNNGQYVVVGDEGTILTSPDGIIWTQRSSGTKNPLLAIVFADGQYIATGDMGTIITSPDGITWTNRESVVSRISIDGIAYGNGRYVAIGEVYYDGNSIFKQLLFDRAQDIWNNSISAREHTVLISPDGIRWSNKPLNQPYDLYGITFANGQFVAVGKNGIIMTSPDGTAWTKREANTTTWLRGITYSYGHYIAVGGRSIVTSPDGITWTPRINREGDLLFAATFFSNQDIAVGFGSAVVTSPGSDGATWIRRVPPEMPGQLSDVIFANGQYVTVGESGEILTSPDGITWTKSISGITGSLKGVAFGNGQYVAVGRYGTIITSDNNGITWVERESWTTNDLHDITYGNGQYVVAGDNNMLLTSTDGITWRSRLADSPYALYAVSYGNGQYIAVGKGGIIITSTDGIDWTARVSGTTRWLYGINFVNGQFVAVGECAILTSTDGVSWKYTEKISKTISTTHLSAVAFGNGRYVVTAEDNDWLTSPKYDGRWHGILTSPDGLTWTEEKIFVSANSLSGITFANGQFVAVGQSATILVSP